MDGAEDIRGGEEANLALVRKAPCKVWIARKYGMILTPFRLFLAFSPLHYLRNFSSVSRSGPMESGEHEGRESGAYTNRSVHAIAIDRA
jgi:hypothetical protein